MRLHVLLFALFLLHSTSGYNQAGDQNFVAKQKYKVHVSDNPQRPKTGYWVVHPDEEKVHAQQENIRVIVRLRNEPLSTGRTKPSAMATEHKKFLKDHLRIEKRLSAAGVSAKTKVLYEYRLSFNGFALLTTRAVAEEIKKLPYVLSVTEDKQVKTFDDTGNDIIRAPQVWTEYGLTGKGIRIGIIDTGVDYTHPDLGGGFGPNFKVAGGYDFFNSDDDPMDDNGHGSHVAGIAAANGESLKGVAPDAIIYAYKVLGSEGYGQDSGILAAIERTLDPDQNPNTDDALDVVNMSLGRYADADEPLSQAVNNAAAQGVVFVIAAGNNYDFFTIGTPAIAQDAITVGATDQYNYTASFSSKGPVEKTFYSKPDVSAPGVDVTSCFLNHDYNTLSGTSMASPLVAGAAALLLEKHNDWSPLMIKSALMGTSKKLNESLSIWEQGAGVINIFGAVQRGFLMEPGEISLGLLDKSETVITRTKTLTIRNTSQESKSFAMGVEGLNSANITLSFNPASFSLDVNAAKEVIVTFTINASLLETLNLPEAYTGVIVATCDQSSVKTIFSMVNPQVTELNFSEELPQTVIVIGINGSYYWKPYSPQSPKLSLYLPKAEYDIITYYQNFYTVITEGVNTESNLSIDITKSLAKNKIIFKPIDKEGNPIAIDGAFLGATLFSGKERNIYTFYVAPEDTFKISDQVHYKFDMELHGRSPGGGDYYDITFSTPYGASEDKIYSNNEDNFAIINIDNPSIGENNEQQMIHYLLAGNPWSYFTTWNTYPFTVPNPLKIYHSKNESNSAIMGSYGEFSPAAEQPGYRWGTALWNVSTANGLSFTKATGEVVTSVNTFPFQYDLGKSLLRYNLNMNNTENQILLSDYPTKGAFHRYYGEKERGTIWYQFFAGETLIRESSFPNQLPTDYNLLLDEIGSPQQYKIILDYEDYQVGGRFGHAKVELDFNTSRNDKNPPGISSLSLESQGLSTTELEASEGAVIKFQMNDLCQNSALFSYCQSSGIRSKSMKIKTADADWSELSFTSAGGEEYTGNLPPGLPEGYYALQLTCTDNDDNKLTYELTPAFLIGPASESAPYAVVRLIEPRDKDINAGENPTFRWSSVENVKNYTIQIAKDQSFKDLLIDVTQVQSTFNLPESLEGNTDFFWRVKANLNTTTIPWSEIFSFYSGTLPAAVLLQPENNTVDHSLKVKFKWTPAPNAYWQTFELSTSEDFSAIINQTGLTSDTVTIHYLFPDTDYYWRVGSYFSTFQESYFIQSQPFHFKTFEATTAIEQGESMPGIAYYPNPFASKINITFASEYAQQTTLMIKDVLGKVVRTISVDLRQGHNSVQWDGKNNQGVLLPDGLYFGAFTMTKREPAYFRMILKKDI
jgi:hypothetical protein